MLTFSFSSLLYLPFPKNEAVVSLSEAPPGEEPDFTILCCLTPPDVFISSPLNYTPTLSLPGPCYHMVLCNSLEVAIPFSDYDFLFRHLSSFLSLNLLQILLLPTPLIGQHMGSKITADGDCSHEIKRHLLLGRKVMTNLDSILKSRDITLLTKVCLVKAMVFPVVMYGCESWTVKKAEHRRIDAFELWCWRRLLSVPWTARRSNQSILKEISPGYSLE